MMLFKVILKIETQEHCLFYVTQLVEIAIIPLTPGVTVYAA